MSNRFVKKVSCVVFLLFSGCDGPSSGSFVDYSEAYKVYAEKVKCVAEINYHPNVKDAKKPLEIWPVLSELSDHKFYVLSNTKKKNNRPDFFKTFVSFKSCEYTRKKLLKNRKFGKCIIRFEEITLTEYQDFFENPNKDNFSFAGVEAPLECEK